MAVIVTMNREDFRDLLATLPEDDYSALYKALMERAERERVRGER